MKKFKNKKDWIKYCEKNFVHKHPDFKNCPRGIIFYGQIGDGKYCYDWFKYNGEGNINWDYFDIWENDKLPKNIKPFNIYYIPISINKDMKKRLQNDYIINTINYLTN